MWGDWGAWGACSNTCGDGKMQRTRNCDNPRKEGDGDDCVNDADGTGDTDIDDCTTSCSQGIHIYRKR